MALERRTHISIGVSIKRRLDDMRDGKQASIGDTRTVSLNEIVADLLAEHDKATEGTT